MNRSRCPWCGKKVDSHADSKKVKKVKMPSALVYARCRHCQHFYGQPAWSKIMKVCLAGIILPVVIGVIFHNLWVMLIALPFPLLAYSASYQKMNEREEEVKVSDALRIRLSLVDDFGAVTLRDIYFLTDQFDELDCFSAVSPICLTGYDKKSGVISGHFLYEHPQNAEYIRQGECKLYNSDMVLAATVRFEPV